MAIRTPISSYDTDLSKPSIAFLDNLISTTNRGIMTGKLNMAISPPALFALEAIPEIIVKTEAKLILPKRTAKK